MIEELEGTELETEATTAIRPEKMRMSVDLTPEMKSVIDSLAAADGTTRAEVMRRAIALLKAVKDAKKKGETPALIDEEGHVKARLVGI